MNDHPITLKGWDAIASYLHVTKETVQSWRSRHADTDPLPIAQPGGRNGPVFAYTDQLDAWMRRRASEPADVRAPADRLVVFRR